MAPKARRGCARRRTRSPPAQRPRARHTAALDFGGGEAWWLPPGRRDRRWLIAERAGGDAPFAAPPDALERSFEFLAAHRRELPPGSFVFVLSDFLARHAGGDLAARDRPRVGPRAGRDPGSGLGAELPGCGRHRSPDRRAAHRRRRAGPAEPPPGGQAARGERAAASPGCSRTSGRSDSSRSCSGRASPTASTRRSSRGRSSAGAGDVGALTRIAAATSARIAGLCGLAVAGAVAALLALGHSASRSRDRADRAGRGRGELRPPGCPVRRSHSRPRGRCARHASRTSRRRCGSPTISRRSRSSARRAPRRSTQGSLELVTAVVPVSCLTAPCVARSGVARVGLPLVHASVLARDGRIARASAAWPTLSVRGRVTASDLAASSPPFEADTTPPAADLPDRSRRRWPRCSTCSPRSARSVRSVSPAGRCACASGVDARSPRRSSGRFASRGRPSAVPPRIDAARSRCSAARSAAIGARAQPAGSPGRSPSPSPHELEELVSDIEQGRPE